MTRWQRLLDDDVVRSLATMREENDVDAVHLDIGPVELMVTRYQALYFIPRFLVPEFESLNVSFTVR